jgi:hypothetical protein
MLSRLIEDAFVVFSIGFFLGAIVIRYYYERVDNRSLGRIIDGAMISDSVEKLYGQSREMESLLGKMRSEADSLVDFIKRCRDIEKRKNDSELYEERIEDETSFPDNTDNNTEPE